MFKMHIKIHIGLRVQCLNLIIIRMYIEILVNSFMSDLIKIISVVCKFLTCGQAHRANFCCFLNMPEGHPRA
jgi:hypothetical protein